MDSILFLAEKVENKQRRFGGDQHYYPAVVVCPDGEKTHALFTGDQISKARQRATVNPEDIPERKGFLARIFG